MQDKHMPPRAQMHDSRDPAADQPQAAFTPAQIAMLAELADNMSAARRFWHLVILLAGGAGALVAFAYYLASVVQMWRGPGPGASTGHQ